MANPYQTPQSDVVTQVELPDSFMHGKVNAKKLGRAGWLTYVYLVYSILITVVSTVGEFMQDDVIVKASQFGSLLGVVLWSYLLIMLKNFLESRIENFNFAVLTYLSIVSGFLFVLTPFIISEPEVADDLSNIIDILIFYSMIFIPGGIITLLYGIKLVRIKQPYPHIKPFGWLTIVMGICLISVVLFMLVIPIGIVSEIFLAMLFFHGRRELKGQA